MVDMVDLVPATSSHRIIKKKKLIHQLGMTEYGTMSELRMSSMLVSLPLISYHGSILQIFADGKRGIDGIKISIQITMQLPWVEASCQ